MTLHFCPLGLLASSVSYAYSLALSLALSRPLFPNLYPHHSMEEEFARQIQGAGTHCSYRDKPTPWILLDLQWCIKYPSNPLLFHPATRSSWHWLKDNASVAGGSAPARLPTKSSKGPLDENGPNLDWGHCDVSRPALPLHRSIDTRSGCSMCILCNDLPATNWVQLQRSNILSLVLFGDGKIWETRRDFPHWLWPLGGVLLVAIYFSIPSASIYDRIRINHIRWP